MRTILVEAKSSDQQGPVEACRGFYGEIQRSQQGLHALRKVRLLGVAVARAPAQDAEEGRYFSRPLRFRTLNSSCLLRLLHGWAW